MAYGISSGLYPNCAWRRGGRPQHRPECRLGLLRGVGTEVIVFKELVRVRLHDLPGPQGAADTRDHERAGFLLIVADHRIVARWRVWHLGGASDVPIDKLERKHNKQRIGLRQSRQGDGKY